MDLTQVGHLRTAPRQMAMAHERARMRIPFHSQTLNQNEAPAS
jgi:hypothetical protein